MSGHTLGYPRAGPDTTERKNIALLEDIIYYVRVYLTAVAIFVFYFGLRYIFDIRVDMVEYFLDSKKPPAKRLGLLFLITVIIFVIVLILFRATGKEVLLF